MSEAALRRGKITLEDRVASFPPYPADWYIEDEEQVPESRPHDLEGEHLRQLFLGWQLRFHLRNIAIGRNIAVRSDQTHPGTGVDPDVYVLENPPAGFDYVTSMRLWESGYFPPLLCVEIVSESRPEKDYTQSPLKYAVNGTQELWIFDPKMCRRPKYGEPIRLQVWRRDDNGNFMRIYAGEGPAYSEAVHAWVFVTNEGQNINIADDAEGTQWWMTPAEQERAAKLEERAAKEAALAAKHAALVAKDAERAAKEQERAAKEQALEAKHAALVAKDAERAAKEQALAATDAERVAKEQALAATDAERVAKEQALAATDAERVAKEQALAATDAERVAKEQALAATDAERVAKEQALAATDAERVAKEQALAATDAERVAKEQALAATDAERVAKEQALAATDAERVAKEQALAATDAERVAKEQALEQLDTAQKKVDDERVAKEEAVAAKEQALARIAELEALLSRHT